MQLVTGCQAVLRQVQVVTCYSAYCGGLLQAPSIHFHQHFMFHPCSAQYVAARSLELCPTAAHQRRRRGFGCHRMLIGVRCGVAILFTRYLSARLHGGCAETYACHQCGRAASDTTGGAVSSTGCGVWVCSGVIVQTVNQFRSGRELHPVKCIPQISMVFQCRAKYAEEVPALVHWKRSRVRVCNNSCSRQMPKHNKDSFFSSIRAN